MLKVHHRSLKQHLSHPNKKQYLMRNIELNVELKYFLSSNEF